MSRPKGTKYIETPERMWELFEAYRKDVKDNPRHVFDFVGKDGNKVKKPLEVPLTIEGFKNYCYDNVGCVHQYLNNQEDEYKDYLPIITRIKDVIRQDQIEGGMVGQYQQNLTARLNGLVDKKETEIKGSLNIPNLPDIGGRK